MMSSLIKNTVSLSTIKEQTKLKRKEVSERMEKEFSAIPFSKNVCVYACGSMGRLEMTDASDLDLFFISTDTNKDKCCRKEETGISTLNKYRFFGTLYKINSELGYSDPSKGGEYWDFISDTNLIDIGSRKEDYNNSFTARMLLILESTPLFNPSLYNQLTQKVVDAYFRDYEDNKDGFVPLFIMNDIKRYWYTLTVNYEARRDKNDDNNKKYWKRLKLKYARLLTCYSMIACLYERDVTSDYVIRCINMTPFERLEMLTKNHPGEKLDSVFESIKNEYEWFLRLRKEGPEWWDDSNHREEAFSQHSPAFHDLIIHKFLGIISETNPHLKEMTDEY